MIYRKPLLIRHYIFKHSLYGVLYRHRESLVHMFSKMIYEVAVNGEHCGAMINDFFVFELENVEMDDFWCQQDGATNLTANETIS